MNDTSCHEDTDEDEAISIERVKTEWRETMVAGEMQMRDVTEA